MKVLILLFPPIFILGLLVVAYMGKMVAPNDIDPLGWVLLVTLSLALTWLIATVFNLAIFAPVYWFLGRSAARKKPTEKPRETETNQRAPEPRR